MQLDSNLEAVINKTIALHNRVYSPDVTAKLVSFSPTQITILFSGGFCYQCSTIEITDVFEKQFKALSSQLQIKVGKTRQVTPRSFEADFSVKTK